MSEYLLSRDPNEAVQEARALLTQAGLRLADPDEANATGLLVEHEAHEDDTLPWVRLTYLVAGEPAQTSRASRQAYQEGLETLRSDGWRFRKRPWSERVRGPQLQRTIPAPAAEHVVPADVIRDGARWNITLFDAEGASCGNDDEAVTYLVDHGGHTRASAAAMLGAITTVDLPAVPESPSPRSSSWQPLTPEDLPEIAFEWSPSAHPHRRELTIRCKRQRGVVPRHHLSAFLHYRADGYWWLCYVHTIQKSLIDAVRCAPVLAQARTMAQAYVAQAVAEADNLPTPGSRHEMMLPEQVAHPGPHPALGVDGDGVPVEWDTARDLIIANTEWLAERADPERLDTMALAVARKLADAQGTEAVVVIDAAPASTERRDEELKDSGMDVVVAREAPDQVWELVSTVMASEARIRHRVGPPPRFLVVLEYGSLPRILAEAGHHAFRALREGFEGIDSENRETILVATDSTGGALPEDESALIRQSSKLESFKGMMWQYFPTPHDEEDGISVFQPIFHDGFTSNKWAFRRPKNTPGNRTELAMAYQIIVPGRFVRILAKHSGVERTDGRSAYFIVSIFNYNGAGWPGEIFDLNYWCPSMRTTTWGDMMEHFKEENEYSIGREREGQFSREDVGKFPLVVVDDPVPINSRNFLSRLFQAGLPSHPDRPGQS